MIENEVDGFLMFDNPMQRGYTAQLEKRKRHCVQLNFYKIDLFEKTYPSDRLNLVYKTRGASIESLNLIFENEN